MRNGHEEVATSMNFSKEEAFAKLLNESGFRTALLACLQYKFLNKKWHWNREEIEDSLLEYVKNKTVKRKGIEEL